MFQMGGVGPMFGQVHHFLRAAKEQVPYAIERYTKEKRPALRRARPAPRRGAIISPARYSIADIATYPWVARHEWHKIDLDDFPEREALVRRDRARGPAVQRGMAVPG